MNRLWYHRSNQTGESYSSCATSFHSSDCRGLSAATSVPQIDKSTVLDAISTFRVNSLSEDGRNAGAVVILFVDRNHEVLVRLCPKALAFLSNKPLAEKYRTTLFAAFVVGDVDSQLRRHQKKDDSYAGVLQLIETYRQIQGKNPKLRIAEVEELIQMEKHDQLKTYVSQ
jgi:hypothetical protein